MPTYTFKTEQIDEGKTVPVVANITALNDAIALEMVNTIIEQVAGINYAQLIRDGKTIYYAKL